MRLRLFAFLSLLALAGCAVQEDPWKDQNGLVKVVVSFPPLASFVKGVGGDHVAVRSLCTTQGPHHYEYSVGDATQLRGADFFFINGLQLDDQFADKMRVSSGNPKLRYVKLGDRLPPALLLKFDPAEAEHDDDHEHEHHHGTFDPHVWLGIDQAVAMIEIICDQLKEADPDHAGDFDRNAAHYMVELKKLQEDGKKLLAGKKEKRIVSFHDSLKYFARSYGLTIAAVIEEGPGDQPTSPRLAQLVKLCVDDKVHVIAVEPQYPKSTSATLVRSSLAQKGVSAELVQIDPLETSDGPDIGSDWYLKKMRENLGNLARGLPNE